ncbi:response regulator of citrate/malate metabolism [Halorussus salinus]|uniref:response regulator of citrate/malate metabolism n=1 Tax=Halorussus salinus TaxID=1364935 RepID=UPI001091AD8E|nr:response regulator of citrate/malate metabolism [Halorussus salinus]
MDERERDEGGKYVEEVTLDAVMAVFEETDLPVLTTSEVADEVACSRPAAYNKLETLVEQGDLHKKKVGARAAVYIRLDE